MVGKSFRDSKQQSASTRKSTCQPLLPESRFRLTTSQREEIMTDILPNGAWNTADKQAHQFDSKLANALAAFLEHRSVIDFGCGAGGYVHKLSERADCRGYDGNPQTPNITAGQCECLDISQPVQVHPADWVLCLEVAEHLPPQFEETLLSNLDRHALQGIILSWAHPGQGGVGHVNERSPEYVHQRMVDLGYRLDEESSQLIRSLSRLRWFRSNLMVFRKCSNTVTAN